MKTIASILLLSFALLFTGCDNSKIEKSIDYLAAIAPEGAENAVDGYRTLTVKNVGKWDIHFAGLYKENGYVYAQSFRAEGMWSRYEGAPFAYPYTHETSPTIR